MLKVGLTGGIGSGKTLVGEIFKRLGIPIFNADFEAKKITNTDAEVIQKMKIEFGEDIYLKGEIDRKKLASIIFNHQSALSKVNSIIHPKVHEYFHRWMSQYTDVPYVIEEAAILFESNAYKDMDFTINVHADEFVRINRVVERDKTSSESVQIRMNNQFSDKERMERANFTIHNDGKRMVLPQVIEIHHQILKTIS